MTNYGPNKILDLNTSFERSLSKLSENHKIIAHGPRPKMTNYGPNKILDLNTSFERSLSKLSENHKIVDIGSTVLKLWLLKIFNYTHTCSYPHTHTVVAMDWSRCGLYDPMSVLLHWTVTRSVCGR